MDAADVAGVAAAVPKMTSLGPPPFPPAVDEDEVAATGVAAADVCK